MISRCPQFKLINGLKIGVLLFFCNSYSFGQTTNGCDFAGAFLPNWPAWACNDLDYVLVFEENFESDELDESFWQLQPWGYGSVAGDGSQQHYRLENLEINNGIAKIIAKEETLTLPIMPWKDDDWIVPADGLPNLRTYNYTSSSIWSKKSFFTGKYEIRCKLPEGTGLWPAFWTYADGQSGWNEIDIFEIYGDDINRFTSNIHHKWMQTDQSSCGYGQYVTNFNQWHTFTCTFEFDQIKWYIDDVLIRTIPRFETINNGYLDCSDPLPAGTFLQNKAYPLERMHIIFNMAIQDGGNAPNANTLFPSYFEIDYIKYYLKRDCCENKIVNSIEDLGLVDNPEAFNFLCGSEIEINGDVKILSDVSLNIKTSEEVIMSPGFSISHGARVHVQIAPDICGGSLKRLNKSTDLNKVHQNKEINENAELTISPNPVTDICYIIAPLNAVGFTIVDLTGQLIMSEKLDNEKKLSLDLSHLSRGVYIISILAEEGKPFIFKKILKL